MMVMMMDTLYISLLGKFCRSLARAKEDISLHTPIIMAEIYAICDVGDSAEHSVTSMLRLEGLVE